MLPRTAFTAALTSFADERVSGSARDWLGAALQAVALLHGRIVRIDLAQIVAAEALVDVVEVRAHQLLLGFGDAPAVRLAGVLQRGVVDLGAAGAGACRAPGVGGARTAAVLGDEGVLDGAVHDSRPGKEIEVLERYSQALAPARAGADPFHGDETR